MNEENSNEFDEGYKYADEKKVIGCSLDNPYDTNSQEYEDWIMGFYEYFYE